MMDPDPELEQGQAAAGRDPEMEELLEDADFRRFFY